MIPFTCCQRPRRSLRGGSIILLLVLLQNTVSATPEVISSKESTTLETSLGNLLADAVKQLARSDVALIPGSILRDADLAMKDLAPDDVVKTIVDPDQQVVIVQLTGTKLREALERSVSLAPKPSTSFLQVSGIAFQYDLGSPSGKRVGNILIGRRTVTAESELRVAMPRELASGALGYFRVWGDLKSESPILGNLGDAVRKLLAGNYDVTTCMPGGRIRRN